VNHAGARTRKPIAIHERICASKLTAMMNIDPQDLFVCAGQAPLDNGLKYRLETATQVSKAVLNLRWNNIVLFAMDESGDRAMFAYDFICRDPIGVCRTAELVRFQDGLIRDIELFFDARPFEAMQRAQAASAAPK
jgi:hypothetical protein